MPKYADGGPVNSGKLIIPEIGALYCPIIKPDTTGLQRDFEEDFLAAMIEPIADESEASNMGCVFIIRMPDEAELAQLRSEVSREISPNTKYYTTSHDATLEDRVNEALDRKRLARDNNEQDNNQDHNSN